MSLELFKVNHIKDHNKSNFGVKRMDVWCGSDIEWNERKFKTTFAYLYSLHAKHTCNVFEIWECFWEVQIASEILLLSI